jgi:hypothetical protein
VAPPDNEHVTLSEEGFMLNLVQTGSLQREVGGPTPGIWVVVRRVAQWFVFGLLPVAIFVWWNVFAIVDPAGDWAFDFRQFWQGGNDVVNGVSPYPSDAQLDSVGDHLGPVGIQEVFRFPYPAGSALASAPFGAIDFDVASAFWGALLVVSLFAAVWILGVRDWRVMGVVLASAPVIAAVRIGTLTPILILLLAVAWRWRDRRWAVSGSLAAAVVLKLFLWPLVVWLAATRRFAAAALSAVLAAAVTLGAWAVIGFDGLAEYPELVSKLSDVVADRGFSLVALGVEAGLSESAAQLLPWLVGLPVLLAVALVARRDEGDVRSFSLAVLASLVLTPIVWQHYFALLVVPLALARPNLSRVWALMIVFWLVPAQESDGALWRVVLASSVVLVVAAFTTREIRGRSQLDTARRV